MGPPSQIPTQLRVTKAGEVAARRGMVSHAQIHQCDNRHHRHCKRYSQKSPFGMECGFRPGDGQSWRVGGCSVRFVSFGELGLVVVTYAPHYNCVYFAHYGRKVKRPAFLLSTDRTVTDAK